MKFLFWQFSAFAVAALLVGVVAGRMLAAPRVARARRGADAAQRRAEALVGKESESEALQHDAARLAASLVREEQLGKELQSTRDALMIAETDLHVAVLARTHAEATLEAADARRRSSMAQAARVHHVERDLAAVTAELAALQSFADDERRVASRAIVEAEGRARLASDRLEALRGAHAELVRWSQTAITHAEVRAEQAEAATSALGAKLAQQRVAQQRVAQQRVAQHRVAQHCVELLSDTNTGAEPADAALLVLHHYDDPAILGSCDDAGEVDVERNAITIDLASARSARSARYGHPATVD